MRPAAIVLKECHLHLRNNIRQVIYTYIYIIYHEKSQLNILVWGSLTLASGLYCEQCMLSPSVMKDLQPVRALYITIGVTAVSSPFI